MKAWSLNYRDLLVAAGEYGIPYTPGLVPLSDGAGEVIEVGHEVTQFKVGDKVAGSFFPEWQEGPLDAQKGKGSLGGTVPGLLAERVAMPEWCWVAAPTHLSFAQIATLPCAAVTAWNALFDIANLRPGQTVLLQGTGGVSLFGLQLAKTAGARVIITSSSDAKLERARVLGADSGINYRTESDWERAAFAASNGGVDVVLEVGGGNTLARSLRATRHSGHVAVIGILSGFTAEVPIGLLLSRNIRISGVYVGSRAQFKAMNYAIEVARLEPVIDSTFPFEEALAAYRRLASREHFGKVVITR